MEAKQTPIRIHRSDYSPFAWTVTDTRLDIHINKPDTFVSVTLNIRPNPEAKPSDELLLNGGGLTLTSIEVDGMPLDDARYRLDSGNLRITGLTGQHQVKVTSTCTPYTNTALEGLYMSRDMLCTQCEPEGFRQICYYPDRPDVMSIFTVRIEADFSISNYFAMEISWNTDLSVQTVILPYGMIRIPSPVICLLWLQETWLLLKIISQQPPVVMLRCKFGLNMAIST